MLTKEELLNQLDNFYTGGKPVIVHTSLKAVGKIDGGAETLLSALIESFTKNGGLLCIPSHTWNTLLLDLNKAESCIGVLPAVAAAHKEGVRSLHPTHSMVVFGDGAEEFVKNEKYVDSPTSPAGCYGNIYRGDGYILLIGVGHEKNTFIHCVEEMLNIPDRLTEERIEATIIHKDGKCEKRFLRWFDAKIPDVSVNFGKFEAAFRHFGCIQDAMLGNAKVQMCKAGKIKDVLEIVYKNAGGKELLADSLPLDKNLYR